jgi:hypothetical protein
MVHTMPAPYDTVLSTKDLRNLTQLSLGLAVPGKRTTWIIRPDSSGGAPANLLNELKNRGLLVDNTLQLNGWIYVDADAPLTLTQSMTIKGNGGIVLRKGNITIRHEIKPDPARSPAPILTLVTKDGDILVETNRDVHASLIAPAGKVLIGNAGRPTIKGQMIMRQFDITCASQGAKLDYDPLLAVLPNQTTDEDRSEKALLGITVNPQPVFLK